MYLDLSSSKFESLCLKTFTTQVDLLIITQEVFFKNYLRMFWSNHEGKTSRLVKWMTVVALIDEFHPPIVALVWIYNIGRSVKTVSVVYHVPGMPRCVYECEVLTRHNFYSKLPRKENHVFSITSLASPKVWICCETRGSNLGVNEMYFLES